MKCCRRAEVVLLLVFLSGGQLVHHVEGLINLADVPCGKPGLSGGGNRSGRIVGGSAAAPGRFPWMVSIKYHGGSHFCGGTIIHRQYVLSAAHCFTSLRNKFTRLDMMRVTVGEHMQDASETPLDSIDLNITRVIFHPHFQEYSNANDIVLLHLESSISWTSSAQPLCLSESQDKYPPQGVIAGWGRLREKGDASRLLHEANISILHNYSCQLRFRLALIRYQLTDMQICAGQLFGGVDTCTGDSGGPLMVHNGVQTKDYGEQMSALGIVSMGKGCGRIGLPGIYTRVPSYTAWIQRHVNNDH